MPVICPCCLQPMPADRAPVDALELAPLSPLQRRIVKALASSYPRRVTMQQLIDACYWDDPEGGPVTAETVIRKMLHEIRKKLPPYGWTIPRMNPGPAVGYNAYRLEALEAA